MAMVVRSGELFVAPDGAIGTLALARFPREAALASIGEGGWLATADSGAPLFGVPQGPGRGALIVTRPDAP